MSIAREIGLRLRRTPLHPQWLLGSSTGTGRWIARQARGRVLDIGCADNWIRPFLPNGCEYIGLDYIPTGREMYRAHPDVFADAIRLPFSDASVDTVVFLEVMEHLRHPDEALREIARVLKPEGRLLLSVPFLYPVHDAPYDFRRFTVHGLMHEIESAGLSVTEVRPTLGAAETAGLVSCLALGGMVVESIRLRSTAALLVPLVAVALPIINLLAWIGGRLFPSWHALTAGYRCSAIKT